MIGNHLLRRGTSSRQSSRRSPAGRLPLAGTSVLCLCLHSFCQAADSPAMAPAPSQVTALQQPPASDSTIRKHLVSRTKDQADASHRDPQPDGALASQLWSSRIAAPAPNEDTETRLALHQLIQQVRSVKFDNGKSVPPVEPHAGPQVVPTATETAPAARQVTTSREPPLAVPVTDENGSLLSSRARKTLESLLQDPRQVHDPLEMAELLFLSGRATEAAAFYEKALEHTSAGEAATAQDRAWILFQLANCLRETDSSKAQKIYAQLISEYPASPWTELAKAQGQLVDWYQRDQPHRLIASRQP